MKRIAVSLGSLSLVLMQNGHCEPQDAAESLSSEAALIIPTSTLEQEQDDLALDEVNERDLEEELLALEKELEDEQSEALSVEAAPAAAAENIAEELALEHPQETVSEELSEEIAVEERDAPEVSEASSPIQSIEPANSDTVVQQEEPKVNLLENKGDVVIINDPQVEASVDTATASNETMPQQEISESNIAATEAIPAASQNIRTPAEKIEISLQEVFSGSPTIYLMLLFLSVVSLALWLFNAVTLKKYATASDAAIKNIRDKLVSNHYDDVLTLCKQDKSFFSKIMASGVSSRKYGLQFMLESMKSEGKRASVSFWQRLSLIQDIAIIAPMLGLLGTVLGMFYAFYDLNRSFESISSLFDGLGISVGTTVAGIFVAILAMILHSLSKYRLVKALSFVENEAVALAHLIDSKNSQS